MDPRAKASVHRTEVLREQDLPIFIPLSEGDEHHLAVVLRLEAGAKVQVYDGDGKAFLAILERDGQRFRLLVQSLEEESLSRGLQRVSFFLYQAPPRVKAFEEFIPALSQVGLAQLIPVVSKRSVLRPASTDASDPANRQKRWQRLADESAKQANRAVPLSIEPWLEFAVACERGGAADLAFLLDLEPPRIANKTALWRQQYEARLDQKKAVTIALLVGPEGGFTDEERQMAFAKGWIPLWLGPLTLRSETAGLVAMSALQVLVHSRA